MGGGYGNYNGFNQMGGYNQSGAYPEMMNQYPKNNFSNQNQNRFHANQGGPNPQRNMRNGSQGNIGPGLHNEDSRPGSQNGPAQNVRRFQHALLKSFTTTGSCQRSKTNDNLLPQRDDQSHDGATDSAAEAKGDGEQGDRPNESTEEGKTEHENTSGVGDPQAPGDTTKNADAGVGGEGGTDLAETNANDTPQGSGLNHIQTFDSGDADQNFSQTMMGDAMQGNMAYPGMMNNFGAAPGFNPHMNMGYNNNFGPRGGFHAGGAYGAAKVLTEQPAQPIGVGVAGAPTGPRAMREGRPNTGFSSRVNNARFNQQIAKSVTPAQEAVPSSPQRRIRS
jgi:hypothetical protein